MRVLIGFVAAQVLVAEVGQDAADRPNWRDPIIHPDFELVLRDAGQMVARHDVDVAVRVGDGIVGRRERQRRLEGRIDQAIGAVDRPFLVLVSEAGLDPLSPRRADILEEARC